MSDFGSIQDFKIAVINEDPKDLTLFQRLFQKTIYSDFPMIPFQFASGCLSSLMEYKPDIVFVDYSLGILNGVTLIEQTLPFLPKTDFVVTGGAGETAVVEALRAGACDYLKKDTLTPDIIEICMKRIVKQKTAERELLRSEIKFRTIFDKALDVILIVDYRTGLILQANDACHTVLGYKPYQLQGEIFSKLFPSPSRTSFSKILADIRVNGSVIESQIFMKADSTSCPMDVTATLVPYGNDKSVLITLRDVSSRRRAELEVDRLKVDLEKRVKDRTTQVERSNRKLRMEISERRRIEGHLLRNRARLEAAEKIGKMGHWEYDVQQHRIQVSVELLRLFEQSKATADISMPSFTDVTGEEISDQLMSKIESAIVNHQSESMQYWTHLSSGRRACHQVTMDPLMNEHGVITCVLGVIQETTEQMIASENLATALEREKELNQLTNIFVSMVSHELRTPLAVIQSASDLLREGGLNDQEMSDCYFSIESSLNRMTGIMEKMLFLGRVESKQIQFHPQQANLVAICEQVKDDLIMAGNLPHRIQMTFENIPDILIIDESFMVHVITNLLSNALKYSPDDCEVKLVARLVNDSLEIIVQDQGIGIPDNEKTHLFDIFHRCSNARSIPGSGVGMVVIKKCVEAHHGTINFESAEGKGTRFCMRFPHVLSEK